MREQQLPYHRVRHDVKMILLVAVAIFVCALVIIVLGFVISTSLSSGKFALMAVEGPALYRRIDTKDFNRYPVR